MLFQASGIVDTEHALDKITDLNKITLDVTEIDHFKNNLPEQVFAPQYYKPVCQIEMHMAEKLVENTTVNNAFKFDTIIPSTVDENQFERSPKDDKDSSSSDDNGGFVTPPPGDNISKRSQVKRATIVGNPMFSNSPENELSTRESLGLDDLDMDYEQIMHYFDNLKVRRNNSYIPIILRYGLSSCTKFIYKAVNWIQCEQRTIAYR